MQQEEAILELAALGFSKTEIKEFIRIEILRRKAVEKAGKRETAFEILRRMSL